MTTAPTNSLNEIEVKNTDFALNWGSLKTVTLIDSNGLSKTETLPKKYWNSRIKAKQYLEQRMGGLIKEGEDIRLDQVEFTCLEDLEYGDDLLADALKLLIAARDSTDKPEAVEPVYLEAKELILKISPPTKESLDLLYCYAIQVGQFYETKMNQPEKAAKVFVEVGSMVLEKYLDQGLYLICEAPIIMLDRGKHQDSHAYFSLAIENTLKFKKYEKSLELLTSEMMQYEKEVYFYRNKNDFNMLKECILEQWTRVCCTTVVKIMAEGLKQADLYFKKQVAAIDTRNKYSIPGKEITENVLSAFKDRNPKLLEQIKRSAEVKRYLPSYVSDFICGLNINKNDDYGTGILNKKHSNKEL